MDSVNIDTMKNSIISLQKELAELREAFTSANLFKLAEKARLAKKGKGNWTKLENV